MIALIQRVAAARVEINGLTIAQIDRGILALIAIQREDSFDQAKRLLQRIISYRIFPDQAGKMNLSLRDIDAQLMLVPQFTLAADTKSGNRPSFSVSADPGASKQLFEQLLVHAKQEYNKVEQGVFGENMQVSLTNDGPVTFWLEVR